MRLTYEARDAQDFLGELRSALLAVSAAGLLLCLGAGWYLSVPLARGASRLAVHAGEMGRGEFTPFSRPARWLDRFSLRAKLTAALTLALLSIILLMELVALPIERRYIEYTLENELLAGAQWMGEMASESFGSQDLPSGLENMLPEQGLFQDLEAYLDTTELFKLERLQLLNSQTRGDDLAYIALVDNNGDILLSDQMALVGEQAPVPADTTLEKTTWLGSETWIISTPLRSGVQGEQIGALRVAMHLGRLRTFLNESRDLFLLAGVIALLAGILFAQVIGGAVSTPVRRLAAGTRRVAQGDLNVQFEAGNRDEFALLADAYNQMVIGLREREWLRDMFGRFVSQEVAEAIRSGQVRLEGENRMVSVLFCDIRGFTSRSERCLPEQVVALLNQYLPVVVEAAQAHQGTVNKFGGDSTLVIYGAPRRLQESAYQAVLTALDLRARLQVLNQRLAANGDEPIRIGVGINTGMALAGAVGPHERQEYTVIGDSVNLAARIEALNKDYPEYDILISQYTYEALEKHRAEFRFADLGEVPIRGKQVPVRIWAVLEGGIVQNFTCPSGPC